MAVADSTVYIIIATFVSYFLVYRKNMLLGNILFMGIGLGMLALGSTTNEKAFGFIFLIAAVLSLINDYARDLSGLGKA